MVNLEWVSHRWWHSPLNVLNHVIFTVISISGWTFLRSVKPLVLSLAIVSSWILQQARKKPFICKSSKQAFHAVKTKCTWLPEEPGTLKTFADWSNCDFILDIFSLLILHKYLFWFIYLCVYRFLAFFGKSVFKTYVMLIFYFSSSESSFLFLWVFFGFLGRFGGDIRYKY